MLIKSFLFLYSTLSLAQAPANLEKVQFSGQIVSQSPYQLRFQAPAGHHFNQEAPAKVELKNATASQSGKIEKSLQTMTVSFAPDVSGLVKGSAACSVKAQLYVCDNANTYCLPIKREFDCKNLQVKN